MKRYALRRGGEAVAPLSGQWFESANPYTGAAWAEIPRCGAFTRNEPLGVVAAITPWNSPLLLAAWKVALALGAGCTVVIKPSEFTSALTLEFAELFDEVGFPAGVFNVVTGNPFVMR